MSSLDTRTEPTIDGAGCGIAWLDRPEAVETELVGAKAANLAIAGRADLPILPGFVITTAVARRVAAGGYLGMPRELHQAWAALTEGGERALVVRSSSVLEDGASSSMAGRFESVLDVRGWRDFVAAARRVVESGRIAGDAPMAVLVQPMLVADVGGVLFGADPVTGRRDRLVAAVVEGGPDRLVSGLVQGTHYDLGRHGRLRSVDGDGPRLGWRLRRQLAGLAHRAEATFGGPQDIEWATDGDGHLVLLQARPVTTLVPVAPVTHGPRLGPGPVAETLPGVLAELEQDLWVDPLRDGLAEALLLAGAATRRQVAASPVVAVVEGQVAADLDLLGIGVRRSFWRRLDPRPPARRLAAAWRVGRLRAAAPALADDLVATADRLLLDVPALDRLSAEQLLGTIERSRRLLVALHGHEVLAGLLLGSAGPDAGAGSGAVTGIGAALSALADGRSRGLDDAAIVAAEPVVLALLPPRVGGNLSSLAGVTAVTAPAAPVADGPVDAPPSSDPDADVALLREALRLRARWVQELQARVAVRLGLELAGRGDLPRAGLVRHLRLAELAEVVAGRPVPAGLLGRAAPVTAAPLPGTFRLTPDGTPIAARGEEGGRGAGGGRGVGPVVHRSAGTADADNGNGIGNGAATAPAPGSVLVVRTLDPSLAPYLSGLGGLVAETGSVLSHLAILARESGVPTVVGVDDALRRLPEGAVAYVDGTTGAVGLVDPVTAGSATTPAPASELREAS